MCVLLFWATLSAPLFPEPPELAGAMSFWRQLFLNHDGHQALLHDRQNMELIWKVVDLPRDGKGQVNEGAARKLLQHERQVLERTLAASGASNPEHSMFPQTTREVLQRSPELLTGAASRIRVQHGVADDFREGLERARPWLPRLVEILKAEQVPPELVSLVFVESMFQPHARSSDGAVGIWQLMPGTARELGLHVPRGRRFQPSSDERVDILKATRAAAKMLRQNYRALGTWPLAITAYNHGPNGVRRAVKAVGSTDLIHLIAHYKRDSFGFASKNFYAEFLTVLSILRDQVGPTVLATADP